MSCEVRLRAVRGSKTDVDEEVRILICVSRRDEAELRAVVTTIQGFEGGCGLVDGEDK